ncbi:hypothetical protein OS242_09980 [Tumebacillus sp. DT12]|uniref:Uncharacterized protein n=1 Tax=Tumebacillus lacus TaxID=2995335 RepID=A0ABT3X3U3_9BACL|nr:hypothetical protein [Tumebacillus lacus]MCX7570291.1 hypothetical protein [Tumebacillus lacus]
MKHWNRALPLLIGVLFATTSVASASGTQAVHPSFATKQTVTLIELTKEEAQHYELLQGGHADASIAGGTVAYSGKLSEAEKKAYKTDMLSMTRTATPVQTDTVTPQWCTGLFLKNVSYLGNNYYFTNQRIGASEGAGPITLSVTVSKSVSATFSANVGVSAEVVSAGVGYSVTGTYGVSSTGTWAVPSGTYGRLEAYALHDKHSWEVWEDDCGTPTDTYKGNGNSWKPNGSVYFKKVTL